MYTTNAIDMVTPYVSARAATTAPITPHGSAWVTASQNLMALQTSDGVTLISPQRVVDAGRSLARRTNAACFFIMPRQNHIRVDAGFNCL
jgi:hypothetical protein